MKNPYITKIGNILPEITGIITDIYKQKDFKNKHPAYAKIANAIFSYAVGGKEYPKGVLPDSDIDSIAKRMRNQVEEFSKLKIEEINAEVPFEENKFPQWARFIQNHIAEDKKQEIIKLLPEEIKKHKITFMIQVADLGQYMMIHQDHERSASLFYLLTTPDAETRFYKPKKDFKVHPDIRTADVDNVELDHREVIQQGTWYVFNNLAYHSVHALDDSKPMDRASFVIEFVDLPYEQVVELAEQLNKNN